MALLRMRDIEKLSAQERQAKRKDLRFELVRSQVTANKASAKTKEIKRALARLNTFNSRKELKKN